MDAVNYLFESDDGQKLYVYKWAPEAPARAIVHIVHGLAEHAARYDLTARRLNREGFLVYAHDHRGHGRTAGTPERCLNLADRGGWNRAVKDISLLLEAERKENPGLPLALLGHSMGSFMAQQIMYQRPDLLDACALSGSAGKPDLRVYMFRLLAYIERVRIGTHGRSRFMRKLSLVEANRAFRPLRTDFDWLSRDHDTVDKFLSDPFCGWVGSPQLWLDLTYGIIEIARPSNQKRVPPDLPAYVFAGTADPVSSQCRSLRQLMAAYRKAGLTRVHHKFYPEGRHEMLNEINRDEVLTDLVGWFGEVLCRR